MLSVYTLVEETVKRTENMTSYVRVDRFINFRKRLCSCGLPTKTYLLKRRLEGHYIRSGLSIVKIELDQTYRSALAYTARAKDTRAFWPPLS